MKCFCIGLTKTGTTSFNNFMRSLGLRTHGFSRALLNEYLDLGGIGPKIDRAIDRHDAFDDWPWPFLYKQLLARYGSDAVFVLTRRSSPDAWLQSIKRYALSSRTQRIRKVTYGTQFPHGFEAHYLHRYKSHLAEVRAHFEAAGAVGQLIEGDISDRTLFPRTAAALDFEMPRSIDTRSNKTIHRPEVAVENLAKINRSLLGLGKRPISLTEAGFVAKSDDASGY